MSNTTHIEDHEPTLDEMHQAEVFMRVLIKQGHNVYQISNIMSHMGKLFVEHANEIVGKSNIGAVNGEATH